MTKKFKKGDQVIVITGRSKNIKGQITKVYPQENKVLVSGVNIVTAHVKPSANSQGGIIKRESKIDISNIAHIDPESGLRTRIYIALDDKGNKVRFAKRSKKIIG